MHSHKLGLIVQAIIIVMLAIIIALLIYLVAVKPSKTALTPRSHAVAMQAGSAPSWHQLDSHLPDVDGLIGFWRT